MSSTTTTQEQQVSESTTPQPCAKHGNSQVLTMFPTFGQHETTDETVETYYVSCDSCGFFYLKKNPFYLGDIPVSFEADRFSFFDSRFPFLEQSVKKQLDREVGDCEGKFVAFSNDPKQRATYKSVTEFFQKQKWLLIDSEYFEMRTMKSIVDPAILDRISTKAQWVNSRKGLKITDSALRVSYDRRICHFQHTGMERAVFKLGTIYKFQQNKPLLKALLATKHRKIVHNHSKSQKKAIGSVDQAELLMQIRDLFEKQKKSLSSNDHQHQNNTEPIADPVQQEISCLEQTINKFKTGLLA